jgi:DNA polymerase-3 subunit epsilon
MIHQVLPLARPLIVLDGETTSLDTNVARFVELGFQIWEAEGLRAEWRSYINPGIEIPSDATATHGITNAMMSGCRVCGRMEIEHGTSEACPEFKVIPFFSQIAQKLAKGFTNCDFAGKNVRYDLRILAAEFTRAGVVWTRGDARIIDADRLEHLGDPHTLTNLVRKHLGEDMTADAHSALGDVRWTTRLIVAQLANYASLPRDLDALHALQFPGMIDLDNRWRFDEAGVPRFTNWGKHAGQAMRDVPIDYYDFILREDFSAEAKAIAGRAKLGQFPTRG